MIWASESTWISRFSPNGSVQRWVASPPRRVPIARIMSASRTASLPTFEELRPITPTARSWAASIAPLPPSVVATGMLSASAKAVRASQASDMITPPPATISGRSAWVSRSTMRATCARSGTTRRSLTWPTFVLAIGVAVIGVGAEHVGGDFEMHRSRRRAGGDADRRPQHRRGTVGRGHGLVPARHARVQRQPVDAPGIRSGRAKSSQSMR